MRALKRLVVKEFMLEDTLWLRLVGSIIESMSIKCSLLFSLLFVGITPF